MIVDVTFEDRTLGVFHGSEWECAQAVYTIFTGLGLDPTEAIIEEGNVIVLRHGEKKIEISILGEAH